MCHRSQIHRAIQLLIVNSLKVLILKNEIAKIDTGAANNSSHRILSTLRGEALLLHNIQI